MTSPTAAIHFAVTSHGLGHLTRTLAVLRSVQALLPTHALYVSSTVDPAWIRNQLDFEVHCRHQDYEPGALQHDCFEVDVPATIDAYRQFAREHDARLERECDFLRSHPFVGVVSDIAAVAVRAAGEVGIPALGVSNFTWDWILEPWCGDEDAEVVAGLAADYRTGTRQLRLPFGPARSTFPEHEPAPLVARRATRRPADVRRLLGLDPGRVAVVCPGGWSTDEWPAIHARPGDFQLVTVGDLPVTSDAHCLPLSHQLPDGLNFPDLVAAADVVLGKPGYGLASECVAHRVPFAMIERPGFRETPYLVAEVEAMGRCSSSTIAQFFAGEWEPMLEGALTGGSEWADAEPEPNRRVAERIVELLG